MCLVLAKMINRWCYWLNVIVAGLSVVLFTLCYFPPNFHMINKKMTKMQELKKLDYGGLLTYCSGLILLLLGFSKTLRLSSEASITNTAP